MFDNLQALGLGLITFAITVGIGTVILLEFGAGIASCPYYNASSIVYTFNKTLNTCQIDFSNGTATSNPVDAGWESTTYMTGQLGTSGLAGWTPAIIALAVGLLFLGALFVGFGGRKRTY